MLIWQLLVMIYMRPEVKPLRVFSTNSSQIKKKGNKYFGFHMNFWWRRSMYDENLNATIKFKSNYLERVKWSSKNKANSVGSQ